MANTREIINTLWTSELEEKKQKVKESMENWFSSSFQALAWCLFSARFQRNDVS